MSKAISDQVLHEKHPFPSSIRWMSMKIGGPLLALLFATAIVSGGCKNSKPNQATGTSLTESEAKDSEQELKTALKKVDPSNPDSLKELTRLKTKGGKVFSDLMAEILTTRQASGIDAHSAKLGEITSLENLANKGKRGEITVTSKKLIASSEKYAKDINELINKWLPKFPAGTLDQPKASTLKLCRSLSEWASAILAMANFCSTHPAVYDKKEDVLVFEDKDVAEASRLLEKASATESRLSAVINAAAKRLDKVKQP